MSDFTRFFSHLFPKKWKNSVSLQPLGAIHTIYTIHAMDDIKPRPKKSKKVFRWFLFILLLSLAAFVYVRYYYVFGTGVKSGELSFLVHKGVIFKTYEGKLIQSGLRTDKPEGVQSNQFDFSVVDKALAKELMLLGGKNVQLHYKEYFGALPWRGYTKFIVDSIVSVEEPKELEKEITPHLLKTL
ncbi:MAG: hypothetical protein ACOX19_00460 [Fermentimonas sp.]|jgi:hypothetical protein